MGRRHTAWRHRRGNACCWGLLLGAGWRGMMHDVSGEPLGDKTATRFLLSSAERYGLRRARTEESAGGAAMGSYLTMALLQGLGSRHPLLPQAAVAPLFNNADPTLTRIDFIPAGGRLRARQD